MVKPILCREASDRQIHKCDAEIDGEYVFHTTTYFKAFNSLCIEFNVGSHISPLTLNNVWLEVQGKPA